MFGIYEYTIQYNPKVGEHRENSAAIYPRYAKMAYNFYFDFLM